MELRNGRFCIYLCALLACGGILLAQQSTAKTPGGQHLPVGVWESKQPDGSVIGIDLSSVPASVPDAVYPEGTPRPPGSRLQVGVFQRQHKRIACGEENFFVVGWTGPGSEDGSAVFANGNLEVHYHDRVSSSETHVELVLDPITDVWTGRFHRNNYDGQVILHRTFDSPGRGGCVIGGANSHPS
jgi:hypothetical protein